MWAVCRNTSQIRKNKSTSIEGVYQLVSGSSGLRLWDTGPAGVVTDRSWSVSQQVKGQPWGIFVGSSQLKTISPGEAFTLDDSINTRFSSVTPCFSSAETFSTYTTHQTSTQAHRSTARPESFIPMLHFCLIISFSVSTGVDTFVYQLLKKAIQK